TFLAMEIKTAVGVTKRRRAQRAVFPLYLARGEFRAEQRFSGRAIEEIPDLHRPADCRRQFRFEIHLLRLNISIFDFESDDTAAGPRRGSVDGTIAGDRRGDVGAVTADRFPVTPEKLARLRLDTHQTFLHELNVLF